MRSLTGAFRNCSSLTSITIPEGITSIGGGVFSNCDSITSITIGNGVTSIGDHAFLGCSSLTYTIKGGLKYLGNENNPYLYLADTETTDITTATIDSSCKFIGTYAFSECRSLTSITIPDSVTAIDYAFLNCDSLTSVYYAGTAEEWSAISIGTANNSDLISATRYYYIEREADVPADGGNYWHYDENGDIAIW